MNYFQLNYHYVFSDSKLIYEQEYGIQTLVSFGIQIFKY
jgi:hypothetical protein